MSSSDKKALVRKDLTFEKMQKYFVIHKMTLRQVADMYGVSPSFMLSVLKEKSFIIKDERLKYKPQPIEKKIGVISPRNFV